jgi:hypothetical protein
MAYLLEQQQCSQVCSFHHVQTEHKKSISKWKQPLYHENKMKQLFLMIIIKSEESLATQNNGLLLGFWHVGMSLIDVNKMQKP